MGLEVAAVVSPRNRPDITDAPDARWFTSLDEVLADPTITIVSVCTPTPSHAEIAIAALRAGKNVLLEKPIALTVEDALAVADAARHARGVLMVAHVVRFYADYAALAERVVADAVGGVRIVHATRLGSGPRSTAWLEDEEQSGGIVVDFAIHDFDQANLLLGTPLAVRSLRARGAGSGAPIDTTVEYANGGIAHILSVADLPQGFPFHTSLDIVGERGTDALHGDSGDAFLAQARYFLDCVEAGVAPLRCPTDAAIDALRVALAARESLRTSSRVVLAAG